MPGLRLRRLSIAGLPLALLSLAFASCIIIMIPAQVPANQRPGLIDSAPLLGCLEFAAVGFLVTRRQPRNLIGWMLLTIGIMVPLTATSYYQVAARYTSAAFPAPALVSGVGVALSGTSLGLLVPGFLLFPDGRLLSRRWLPLVGLGVVSAVTQTLSGMLDPSRRRVTRCR